MLNRRLRGLLHAWCSLHLWLKLRYMPTPPHGEREGGRDEHKTHGCRRSKGPIALAGLRASARYSEVISSSRFRIAQRFVGGIDLLETPRGCFVAGIDVRVKLPGQCAVSGLDLLLVGARGKPEY